MLVLLVLVFGSGVAASLPLGVRVLAVAGGMAGTLLLTRITAVSVYATNIVVMIGPGVAIDYSLFMVGSSANAEHTDADTGRAGPLRVSLQSQGAAESSRVGGMSMGNRSGAGLIIAGAIVSFIGVCIVLVKVLRVPEYWVPLMVGIGLILMGVIRRLTRNGS